MSSRYSRPHTPPDPPPCQGSSKSSGRKLSSSSVSSKRETSRSYDDHHNYDKSYSKPSSSTSSYPSSKTYSDDKYKRSSLRKMGSEKVPNSSSSNSSKYPSKSDTYSSESNREYKATREVHYPTGDRYSSKDSHLHHHPYLSSSYPSEKARYSEKYLDSSPLPPYGDTKYANKKYADEYNPYSSEKSSGRYTTSSLRHEGSAYYSSGSLTPYNPYSAYSSYGAYGSSYGGRGSTGSYGTSDKLGYESSKLTQSSYSSLDKLDQASLLPRDKLSSGGYTDSKLGPRSRLYPEDSRRPYRDYTPPPSCSSTRSPVHGVSSTSYSNYGHYSPPQRSPQQYLNRYVIGDSVVYGPPGHYPGNLRSSSPRMRPPSPPSPQPPMSRNYSKYPASPRRYPSNGGRRSPAVSSSQYCSPSPTVRRASSPRRPPSPPPRRPPSPRSPQIRASYRGNHEQSYEQARSKDRYVSKESTAKTPSRDGRGGGTISRNELSSRVDRDKRKEPDRRLTSSREKAHGGEPSKRARTGEHNSDYYHSGSHGWSSKEAATSTSSNHLSTNQKDRRTRSPLPSSRNSGRNVDMSRDRRREDSRERDKSRRIEDRLGPSPSQTSRRSPTLRPRAMRRTGSPRDKRSSSRRHPDLRLWIESRKSEGGKRLVSPNIRSRPVSKRVARSSERSTLTKRTRLGDPKRRLGGYKTRRRTLPLKRNKILKKYQRLTAKRGSNKTSSSSTRLLGRENGGSRRDGGDEGSKGREDEGGVCGDGPRPPGSSATIHRIIKKPKTLSLVNRMVLKPRVIRKPTQKLLRDPKEEIQIKVEPKEKTQSDSQHSTKDTNKSDEKQIVPSASAATTTSSTYASSSTYTSTSATATTTTTTISSSPTYESGKCSSHATAAPTSTTTNTPVSS